MRHLFARSSLVLASATFLALMILLYGAGTGRLTPGFSGGTYRFTNQATWIPFEDPLSYSSEKADVEAKIIMRTGSVRANRFHLSADDCLQKLWVNGIEVSTPELPSCDFTKGVTVTLGPLLRTGSNEIRATLHNNGGPGTFTIAPAGSDPSLLGLRILLLLSIVLSSFGLAFFLRVTGWEAILWAGLTSGILLRLIYLFVTPHDLRGHDTEGHIEYIRFLMENLRIPGAKEGWEFYHPPLYYVLSALWVGIGQAMGRSMTLLFSDLQWHALLMSVGSLLLGVWMGNMIFPRKEEGQLKALFVCILAVFPGLVFFAARINNDVLLAFLEFLAFALILHWWRKGDGGSWIALVLTIAFTMLTKSNAILLVPIAFGCLFFKRGWTHREKIITGIMSLFIILTFTTWNYTLRNKVTDGHPLVPNVTNLNSSLRVESSPETLTEFNPLRVIRHPYNNAWDDKEGRNNFWEYFLKSALFGEFDFGAGLRPLAQALIASAILLIPLFFLGLWEALRNYRERTFPLWFSAIVLLAGHVAFRQSAPFSSCQDFRYSILFLIPATALILMGLNRLPVLPRVAALCILTVFCTLSAAFLLSLTFA